MAVLAPKWTDQRRDDAPAATSNYINVSGKGVDQQICILMATRAQDFSGDS
jgi:hypothetical protein